MLRFACSPAPAHMCALQPRPCSPVCSPVCVFSLPFSGLCSLHSLLTCVYALQPLLTCVLSMSCSVLTWDMGVLRPLLPFSLPPLLTWVVGACSPASAHLCASQFPLPAPDEVCSLAPALLSYVCSPAPAHCSGHVIRSMCSPACSPAPSHVYVNVFSSPCSGLCAHRPLLSAQVCVLSSTCSGLCALYVFSSPYSGLCALPSLLTWVLSSPCSVLTCSPVCSPVLAQC